MAKKTEESAQSHFDDFIEKGDLCALLKEAFESASWYGRYSPEPRHNYQDKLLELLKPYSDAVASTYHSQIILSSHLNVRA